ncbi:MULTISPECIES: MBL fold metallo-hydrolase [unclassified Bosea (in: a-proteobacteria)]|uniref:MBL fold metallo-hydrolase n=1 Tax=unclassified Bosea (in: a-proteobacteria) TaxID=2653178 RepID=UPI000F750E11|nr:MULTISPECIES: MBL fold metallo-hydrolase [unclassified Bosea (in: a-proteobacteria)]AZO78534.1 MBL fold metallo-hydrolase [Bosea sp. Tri-49]RXT19972.1 MBL fold metallo-hydrolase [Bosea sp. Tri-39]RXT36844.1 MBL fold metallo-hydrolase [Bosea sp. Tri-54]
MSKLLIPPTSRRSFLSGAAALAAGAALPGSASAKAPLANSQVPYYYRFALGQAEVTVVSDGPLPLGDPGSSFLGLPKEQVYGLLETNFLPKDNVVLEQNIPIVNFGDRLVMFDTGMGFSKAFGPTTGRLLKSMQEAGIDPAAIDAIVCSHAHIDHTGGICSAEGKPNFPNAQIYISQVDHDYWLEDARLGTPFKAFGEHARANLRPVRDRIVFFKDGQEFLPGITAISAPGHSPGHTIFNVSSGGKSFTFLGDLTHHPVLLTENPRVEFAYDYDPKQSVQSRVKLLTMLAEQKTPVMSYHFAWPGFGNLAKAGDGFRYYPAPMQMLRG